MSPTDPHAALLAAARALRRDGVSGPGLAALFAALDATDAEMSIAGPERAFAADSSSKTTQQSGYAENAAQAQYGASGTGGTVLPLCTAEACGRVADVGLTCFAHSRHA